MRLQSQTVSSQTTSPAIPLDREANPFSVGLKVVVSAGATLTAAVEVTLDDIFNPAVTPTWTALTGLTAVTATTNGNIAFNCTAVRLNVTAFTSGSATLQVMQGKQG